MYVIELEDRKICRPAKGKKVRFQGEKEKYSEIVVFKDSEKVVEEVDA